MTRRRTPAAVRRPEAVVAGHICLDLILTPQAARGEAVQLQPGKLINIGPPIRSTGGAVPNTGLALHRLGVPVAMMGAVGDDLFGDDILDILRRHDPELCRGMRVVKGQPTSYTLVISPPGVDRTFLHCPGVNDSFAAVNLDRDLLRHARLFHFGYPPLMRRMYRDGGRELQRLLAVPRRMGLTVTLDTAHPDPNAESGRVDWPSLLAHVLPSVDVFLPSIEELLFMLDRRSYDRLAHERVDRSLLRSLSDQLLDMGVAVAVIKLGAQGLYLRTTDNADRLRRMGRAAPRDLDAWRDRELVQPCFKVKVAGTTGSGDCSIAGFLAALLRGDDPAAAAIAAAAVGAASVEQPDATSGVPRWATLKRRLAAGWKQHPVSAALRPPARGVAAATR
jgi:sugar/nucleoside kinase (ribokinase family)